MRIAIAAALFAAACGSGPVDGMILPDARLVDASHVDAVDCTTTECNCNPVAQTGCPAADKCTWIVNLATPPFGYIGCAPDGALPTGGACAAPMMGVNGGHDDCVKGTFCEGGACAQICDLNNAMACLCGPDDDAFVVSSTHVAGTCEASCDPLTQAYSGGGAAACGSPNPAAPTSACDSDDLVRFGCAPTSSALYANTDRVALTGIVYANSCAPGYLPLLLESTGSMQVICSGLCAPADTDNTMPQNGKGDPTVLAKQPTDPAPVAGHGLCTPFAQGGKGSVDAEECRYAWTLLFDNAGNPIDSPYADSLGYCFAYSHYTYNATFGPNPACASLPPPSAATPGFDDDAGDWGCYREGPGAHPAARPGPRLSTGRAGDVLARHRLR